MKRRFTILTAALALLTFLAVPMGMWGQTTIFSETFGDNGTSNTAYSSYSGYSATTEMFVGTGTVASHYTGTGKVGKNNLNVSTGYTGASGKSAAWYQAGTGNSVNNALVISGINISGYTDLGLSFGMYRTNGTEISNVTSVTYSIDGGTAQTLSITQPTSTGTWTLINGNLSGTGNSLTITFTMTTTGGYTSRYDDIVVTGVGGQQVTPSDLTLTDAPVALSFDLYNNASTQTVSYTTSSTGAITITPGTSDYFTYVHNTSAKTITVTPTAVTPSAQTVTISQAVDGTYASGSASFTVSITNSEPTIGIPEEQLSLSCEANENGSFSVSFTHGFVPNVISPTLYSDAACQYQLSGDAAWIVITETNQSTINYSVAANSNSSNNAVERTAYLKVTAVDYDYNHSGNQVSINNVFAVTQAAPDYAMLPFAFNNDNSAIAETNGLTQFGLGNYANVDNTKLKFDNTGDWLLLQFNERPGTLTFDIKGNSFSNSTFKVQTSVDGVSYSDLKTYTTFGNDETQRFNDLDENVRYIKWIYTNKENGNVGLGNIALAKYVAPQEYTLEVTSVSNAEIIVFDATDPVENNWVWLFEGVGSAQVLGGTQIALSVSTYEGYALESLMVNGVNHVADIDGGLYSFTITGDATITATAAAIPMAIYSYSNNGVEGQTLEAAVGSTIDLQAGADLNSDFTFAGWTTDPNDVSQRLTSFTFDEEDAYVFYAVYGKTTADGPATTAYQKVTSAPTDGDWAGDYLIAYSDEIFADGRIGGKDDDGSIGKASVSVDLSDYIANNQIPVKNGDIYCVTLEEITTGVHTYVLKTKDGKYNYQTSNSNGLAVTSNKTTAAAFPISVTFQSANDIRLALGGEAAGAVFRFNPGTTNQPSTFFRFYKNCGQEPVYLYKKTTIASTTTTYYTRVFLNENVTDDIEIVGPSIIPNGQILDMGEDYIIENNLGASNLVIEDGGQLYSELAVNATVQKHIIGRNSNGGWNFVASPICFEANPSTVGMINGDYDLYRFNPSAQPDDQGKIYEWENYKVHSTDDFSLYNGHGYLYANLNDVNLVFAGTVNDPNAISSYDYNSGAPSNFRDWHLVGNPYMYAAYPNTSYYVVSGSTIAEPETSGAVAPCEGIMIQGTDGLVNFTRTPANNAQPSNLKVTLAQQVAFRGTVSSAKLDKAIISFNEGSQLSKFYFGENKANIYIPQDGKDYAIVSSEGQGEMPVNFKAKENGTYTLSINAENVEMNYLHLIDNKTGNDIDLLQTPSYSFEAKTTDYESRFKLVFVANNEDSVSTGTETFAFFSNGSFVINNEGNAELQVIDITGHIVKSESINGCANVNVNAAPGVYMLRLVNGDNVKTQKVVVK